MTFDELEKRYGVTKHSDLGKELIDLPVEHGMFFVSELEMGYGKNFKKRVTFKLREE